MLIADVAKEQLAASRMAAAWRLGQWDMLEGLPSPAPHQLEVLDSDERWEVRLGKMLTAVHTRCVLSSTLFSTLLWSALPCPAPVFCCPTLPCPVLPYPCLVLSYSALPSPALPSPALLCPAPPCLTQLTLPYSALPYLDSPYPTLLCPALLCLVFLPDNISCLMSPACHAFTSYLQQLVPSEAAHSLALDHLCF